jgi:hypothetical protein
MLRLHKEPKVLGQCFPTFYYGGTPTYENVYRPEKVDSGERNSVTAKLLSRKFIWHRDRLSVTTDEVAL